MKRISIVAIIICACISIIFLLNEKTSTAQKTSITKNSSVKAAKFQTMLDMTSKEFEAAVKRTDIALLPIVAVEAHGSHLPLGTDCFNGLGQTFYVQKYLREKGFETIIAPPLNIGITNEAGDWTRDGTYMYPGSLTIGKETFVRFYLDFLRSLRDNGLRRFFLYSGHLGGRHLEAIVQIAKESTQKIEGIKVYALIESERLEQMKLPSSANILSIEKGQNFEFLTSILGVGTEKAFSTHADGTETSLLLYFQPESVRAGYNQLPQAPSSRFFEAIFSGDPTKNTSGAGGFPYDKASAANGKKIVDYRTPIIGEAILRVLKSK